MALVDRHRLHLACINSAAFGKTKAALSKELHHQVNSLHMCVCVCDNVYGSVIYFHNTVTRARVWIEVLSPLRIPLLSYLLFCLKVLIFNIMINNS